MTVLEALEYLDVEDDSHWTDDGLPDLEVVQLMADNENLSREDITNAVPGFTRTTHREAIENKKKLDNQVVELQESQKSELEKALLHKSELNEQLNKLMSEKREVENKIGTTQVQLGHANTRVDRLTPENKTQVSIREYLQRQQELKMARMKRTHDFLKHGIRITDFEARSALDRAMARKSSRGGARPHIPAKV